MSGSRHPKYYCSWHWCVMDMELLHTHWMEIWAVIRVTEQSKTSTFCTRKLIHFSDQQLMSNTTMPSDFRAKMHTYHSFFYVFLWNGSPFTPNLWWLIQTGDWKSVATASATLAFTRGHYKVAKAYQFKFTTWIDGTLLWMKNKATFCNIFINLYAY